MPVDPNPADPALCPPITVDRFRQGMRNLAGAVNLIASVHDGRKHGMIATAVCSVSAEPPTLAVCINRKAATHEAIARARVFSVNVLRAEDEELSVKFGGAQTGEARFATRQWARLATGAPVLVDALVAFDCAVVAELAHATHTLFLGQIHDSVHGRPGQPLVYANGRYARLAPNADDASPFEIDYWSM